MANKDWQEVELERFEDTDKYGFVIPHRAYWGVRIPGFPPDKQYAQPTDPPGVPTRLKVVSPVVHSSGWSGSDFSVLATRTPPLFHAFHHKTDKTHAGHGGMPFERRPERNVPEREFQPRNPLRGNGRGACIELFSATFDQYGKPIPVPKPNDIDFAELDTRSLIRQAIADGFFEIYHPGLDEWDTSLVGPLNALWFVILRSGKQNTPIGRLEGGYRLWHHRNHGGKTEGYEWSIWQKNDFRQLKLEVCLAGKLNHGLKECPLEEAIVKFELEWQ